MSAAPKLVGRIARERLQRDAMLRLDYPPFHVLVAIVDGVPCAIEDACNHAGASLSEGDRQGDCVACPMHGYVFELATGHLMLPRGLCEDQRPFVAGFVGDDVIVWDQASGTSIIGW